MPDPTAPSKAAVADAFDGIGTVIGPVVTYEEAGMSLRWVQRLLNIRSARDAAGVIFAEDHLSTLTLLHNESLAKVLADRLLEPLAKYTPRQRDRIEETLLAWLERGGTPEVARYLQVHPQTVRYRMRQIEKIFGPSLREPDTRFNLELALRSRQLTSGVPRVRPLRVPQRRWREPRAVAGASAREARRNGL
ncbi:PucR family transcriptional regulator [Streptomyces halobius]|uniref:Helix-turn-helix domain-containing protein n=1 Tax=Streptomyces halobius TaxID=2879846 RepID=A0ABY4MLR9_9ACTN|nr:helix-turn-helix domain-containing protein [Streptomyces halobius]UQA97276.1 helix-turn-helix domain-containing protein [Streptomyces halobius]